MQTREEKLEYNKQYRLNNKEKIREYRLDNKERIKKQRIDWDLNNKEKIKDQQKQYKENHREKITNYNKEYQANNKEKIKECPSNSSENRSVISKRYNTINSDKVKCRKLKKRYGITLDQYNKMLDLQQGKCKICGISQNELKKSMVVDHNHDTGIVRGLLCDKCNRGLGHFNDNLQVLEQSVKYLKEQ